MGDIAVDRSEAEGLEASVLQKAAQVHAAHAALADALTEFERSEGWQGAGIRSIGHWCDINLGIASRQAARLAAAAARLPSLPKLSAAFADGALSLDKVLAVASVATAESDESFTTIALEASTTQLQRICSTYRDVTRDDAPEASEERHLRRQVTVQPLDDGLVRIVALLEPDEAAIVTAALDTRVETAWRRERPADDPDALPPSDMSERRADALVELATEGLVEGPDPIVGGERINVHVHIDAALLAGIRDDGICHIDGIGRIAPTTVERLMCDAHVDTITELDGIFHQGRTRYTPNRAQRRHIRLRDGGCRFPGCPMRRFVQAHHVVPWDDDGFTDVDNLMLLCPKHHRLFHEGGYSIDVLGDGDFTFRRPDGRTIAPPRLHADPTGRPPARSSPHARSGGAPFDINHTIDGLLN